LLNSIGVRLRVLMDQYQHLGLLLEYLLMAVLHLSTGIIAGQAGRE